MDKTPEKKPKESGLIVVAKRDQDGLGVIISPSATSEELNAMTECLIEHVKEMSEAKTLH